MGGGLILLSCCERNAFKACCGGVMEVVVDCAILTLGYCGGSAVVVTGQLFGLEHILLWLMLLLYEKEKCIGTCIIV